MSYQTITDKKAFAILAVLMVVCFIPFIDKAFHIDEPMYLWSARQILKNPLDFYGFTVNWDGVAQPMAELMQNPPLSSYYLALLAGVFGWNESLLHSGFLVMGLAVVWGTYQLARDMSCSPSVSLFAALIVFCTPAFFVLANYVTCDMTMLAAWVWALILWRRALRSDDWRLYLLSGVLMAAAALAKYFGIALIPLLLLYSFAERRRPRLWLCAFLIPVGAMLVYQVVTSNLYGHGLLSGAALYATGLRISGGGIQKPFTGLVFVGGGLASILCSTRFVAGKRWVYAVLLVSGLFFLFLSFVKWPVSSHTSVGYLVQTAVMAATGGGLMLFATVDVWRKRDSDSLLLLCWIVGTFVFTCFLNWTVSVRALLPLAPAAGLLLARRLRDRQEAGDVSISNSWGVGLVPALVISLMVARADYTHANSAREAADVIVQDLAGVRGNIWFQGHWGYQYYMERLGGKPLDFQNSPLGEGDVIIIPGNNSNTGPLENELVTLWRRYSFDTTCCLTTMNVVAGSGFYTDDWGSVPFVFGAVPPETYQAYILR